jgi:hypothetical protein
MSPTPPSASYLLDINTDSEDSATGDLPIVSPSPVDGASSPANKKKKRKKRGKKKKSPTERRVHFGPVSVREHERCLGTDVVPIDGGWPLGISGKVADEYQAAASVDEFEDRRQQELRDRWLAVMARNTDATEKDSQSSPVSPTGTLETRQFDYRRKIKNPLFGPLNEDDRMRLLVTSNSEEDGIPPKLPTKSLQKLPSPSKSRRARSNSMQHIPIDSKFSGPTVRRQRSNSEHFYTETYPSSEVLHVRNELEQIRVHRTLEGNTGCTCRKLDVYLVPADGGGKKAQHRRMSERKVKEELRKRGKLPAEQRTRAELEQLLHDIVELEPCCWGEDCFCKRNGIGCQADSCSCWLDSHQRKGPAVVKVVYPSVESVRERCGNNMYAVDLDAIHDFRLPFCVVINDSDNNESN